jgi:S-DNA-T family DNA segregation ATPase FtsK/SpoIIIE
MLLQSMILSLAMANPADGHRHLDSPPELDDSLLRMVLIDPKGHAFGLFEGLPHLARSVIWEPDEIAEVLQSLVRVMERRGGNGRVQTGTDRVLRTGPSTSDRPSIVVFIDELADLLMVGGKDVQGALTRLTQRGREAGIHIVAATQKPTTAVLGPLVKANFPVRLVGRVTSAEDARTASGWSGTGAERLMGRGDFLAVAEGRVIRFQAAHVSSAEIQDVVAGMMNSGWGINHKLGKASSAIASLVPSRPMSSSRPTDWLNEMFRGKA